MSGCSCNGTNADIADLIHEVDSSGSIVRSFAQVYRSPSVIVNYQLSSGRIACDPVARMVLYVPAAQLGQVWGFSADGRDVWMTEISGLRTMIVEDRPNGSRVGPADLSDWHGIAGLTFVPPNRLYLQVAMLTRESRGDPVGVHDFVLDSRTGRGSYLGADSAIVRAAAGRTLVTQQLADYPRIALWSY